jgi:hypothetical protein
MAGSEDLADDAICDGASECLLRVGFRGKFDPSARGAGSNYEWLNAFFDRRYKP